MNPREYEVMFAREDAYWWYRGMRSITRAFAPDLSDPDVQINARQGLDPPGTKARAVDLTQADRLNGRSFHPLLKRKKREEVPGKTED